MLLKQFRNAETHKLKSLRENKTTVKATEEMMKQVCKRKHRSYWKKWDGLRFN